MADFVEPAASEFDLSEFDLSDFCLSDFHLESDLVFDAEMFKGYSGRRLKAAIALSLLWLLTGFLHSVSWGHEFVWIVAGIMSIDRKSTRLNSSH